MGSIDTIQQIQDQLDDQGIVFCYSGYMTEDILVSIGATLRQKMELVKADKSASRAIFAIFVEEAQNVIRYSSGIISEAGPPPVELRRGFLAVGREEGNYFVCCGNLVRKKDVKRLNGHLEQIQGMDQDQLKKLYKEVLKGEVPEGSKGAGVGFIDIARRAKGGIEYDFKDSNDGFAYFFLKAFI